MNRTTAMLAAIFMLTLPACSGGNLSSASGSSGLVPSLAQSRTLATSASHERGGRRRPHVAHVVPFEKMYVANGSGNNISIYTQGLGGATLVRSITSGISAPRSLAVDSQGYLYVANGTNVTAYANGSSTVAATFSTGLAQPTTVYVDASDYAYVSDNTNNVVQVYSPYVAHVVPFRTLSTGLSRPHGIAVDSAGHVFVANYGSDSVTVFKPNSTAVLTTITAGIHGPTSLAITPDGDLVVSNSTGNNGNGSLTSYANGAWATLAGTDTTYTNSPQRICFDNSGNMFVPQKGSNVVNVYPNIAHVVPFIAHVIPFQVSNGMLSPSGCSIDDNQTTLGVGNTGGAQPDVELANLQQAAGGNIVQLPITINQSPADVVYGP